MTHPESKTMEIFKTIVELPGEPGARCVLWGASPTEAASHRKGFIRDYGFDWNVTTQTINIPTAKGPLVAWLNANVKG
jgi:hypothetical protein